MVAKGFTGSETTVRDEVAKWRKGGSTSVTAPARLPSASRVSRWLVPWRIIRGEENYASRFIGLMCEKEPQLKIAQQLALDFYRILKTKNKQQLSRWFSNVSESGPVELQRIAAQLHALPGVDFRLPMQRRVLCELRHDNSRQQTRAGVTALNEL